MSLLKHDDFACGRFNVLNNELDDMESGFNLSYNYDEVVIDHGLIPSLFDDFSCN